MANLQDGKICQNLFRLQVLYNAARDGESLVMQVKRIGEIGGRHEDVVA